MSRAFVKEDRPDTGALPDLPLSPHPNHVTPRGLRALQERLAAAQADLARLRARPDRLDTLPERAAERDIRYLSARLASAIPTAPPEAPAEVAFATEVTVADGEGRETAYAIVGEDEADAARGLIAPHSPLARALLGARVGETVEWRRPSGTLSLDVVSIRPLR
jgi:transcription elongation GreA/GreB family factor